MLPAPLHVVVEAAGGKDDTVPRTDALSMTVALDHRTRDRSVDVGDQLGHRCAQP